MGQRGKLPALKVHQAAPLEDLTPPDWLGTEAKSYWEIHAEQLAKNLLLTTATAFSFALCSDLWGRIREMSGEPTTRSYLDTVKAFQSWAKFFRLVPCDKPGAPVKDRHEDKDEFDF